MESGKKHSTVTGLHRFLIFMRKIDIPNETYDVKGF